MNSRRTHKKNLIVSFKNLSDELKEIFKEQYPEGHTDYLQRFDKPNGETIFVVPMETEDSVFMVKFDVKIDTTLVEADFDKDLLDSSDKDDDELGSMEEVLDKDEEDFSHTERVIRHGACEIDFDDDDEPKKKKKKVVTGDLAALGEELAEAFKDEFGEEGEEDFDEEEEVDDEVEKEERDEFEPTDEELMDIDSEIFKNAEIPPEELARMAAEGIPLSEAPRKRGRPRKYPPAPEKPKTGKRGRPRKNKDE